MKLLADESGDDFFRHRLALAALCLAEVADEVRNRDLRDPADRVTTGLFSLWWELFPAGTLAASPHLTRALPPGGFPFCCETPRSRGARLDHPRHALPQP